MADVLTRTKAHNDDTYRFCGRPMGKLEWAWRDRKRGFCHKACKDEETKTDAGFDADELVEARLLVWAA